METAVKRKSIDLPVDTLKRLSMMAVAQGKSLKAYMEYLLISKAETAEMCESPSPSGDEWFDNPRNVESVKRGMSDVAAGKVRTYSMSEIEALLGI